MSTVPASQEPSTTEKAEEQQTQMQEFTFIASPAQSYLLSVTVSLAAFLIALNASLISVAVPTITNQFHSVEDVGWYGTAYLLADCSMQPLTGKIYQNTSLKWTFIALLSIFTVGSIISGVATTSKMLIAGRAIAGIGGSGISNGAMSIISVTVPLAKRPVAISILMVAFGLGVVLGPILGGVITEHASWRWCFFTTTIVAALVLFVLIIIKIPDRLSKRGNTAKSLLRKIDLLGFAIFAPSIIMLLLAIYYGGASIYPWNSSRVIGLFCGFAGALVAFVAWSWVHGENAMIPLSFFRNRYLVASCLNGFFQMGSNIIITYYLAIWFQSVKGASPASAGVMILPLILPQIVTSGFAGVFTQRTGLYLPPGLLGCVLSVLGIGLCISFTPSTSKGVWIGYQIIAGAGRGFAFQAPIIAAQNHLSSSTTDVGTTIVLFMQFLGAAIFVSLAQTLFSSSLIASIRTQLPHINPATIITAGATGYRHVLSNEDAEIMVGIFNWAVTRTFVLAAAGAGASVVACCFIGMGNLKATKKSGDDEKAVAEEGLPERGDVETAGSEQGTEARRADIEMEKEMETGAIALQKEVS